MHGFYFSEILNSALFKTLFGLQTDLNSCVRVVQPDTGSLAHHDSQILGDGGNCISGRQTLSALDSGLASARGWSSAMRAVLAPALARVVLTGPCTGFGVPDTEWEYVDYLGTIVSATVAV